MCQNKIWVVSSPMAHIVPDPLWNLMSWTSTVCITLRTTVFSGSYQNGPLSYIPPPPLFCSRFQSLLFLSEKKIQQGSLQHTAPYFWYQFLYQLLLYWYGKVRLLKSIWMTQRRTSVMIAKTYQGSKSKSWLWQFHPHTESRVSMVMG